MAKEFAFERDGVVVRSANDDESVGNVERPIAEAQPDLVGRVAREDILAAAKEA